MESWDPKTLAKRDRARAVALAVTDRLQYSRMQPANGDFGPSLAGGDAGLAVLFGYLARCSLDDAWEKTAHAAALRMGASLAARPGPPVGLFGGLAGVAFAFWYLSHGDTRYRRARSAVEDLLLPQATDLATSFAQRRGMPVEDYDVVSGLCGVAAYLLCRSADDRALSALAVIVEALVEIVERNESPPAWFTPASLISARAMIGNYPEGNLNCGMAHGASGILAILALAHQTNVPVAHLPAAIERLAHWLIDQRQTQHWGDFWPAAVGVRASDKPTPAPIGWCYGNPGVARALWLAGAALRNQTIRAIAIEALRSVYRRLAMHRNAMSPTFCHGVAGVLHITMRFANDTGLPDLRAAAEDMLERLLAHYSEDAPLGYRDHDFDIGLVDRHGLLDGAAGVALVLLAASSNQVPDWDRIFILS